MVLNYEGITAEIQAFSCFEKPAWLNLEQYEGVPWRDQENLKRDKLGSRQHAFKSVWEQTVDPLALNHLTKTTSKPETWAINWKRWPPNVPPFPKGLKIPVTEVPQIDLRLSLSGQWHQITHGTTIIPVSYGKASFFHRLGGYLNQPQSITCHVSPPSLLFLHSKPGQFYSVKLNVTNSGTVPRRLRILPPSNPCFSVVKSIDPRDTLSPGCKLTLTVQYKPKTSESLNDVLILHVYGDGAIIVPLISASTPNPILEVEEWNCGCSTVGVPRTSHFEIKNVGGEGRFWLLSEDEFTNKYLQSYINYKREVIKESTKELVRLHTEAIIGTRATRAIGMGEASGLIKRKPDSLDKLGLEEILESTENKPKEKRKVKPRIYTKCFRIDPTCFRLQRNQMIRIKVRYHPKDANFHYEKLAIMCDNGEVRWIAVKGLGIERDSDKLVELTASWTGPPVDLPSDPRTKYVLDCGDLINGELGVLTFSVTNKSCIPLYYFWSIRPVLTNPEDSPENTEIKLMERFYESTLYDQDGNSFFTGEVRDDADLESWISLLPLTVCPSQGVMEKKQETQVTFTAVCPTTLGYHACILSLYVEQIDEDSKRAVVEALKELGKDQLNIPISHADLSKEVPPPVEEPPLEEIARFKPLLMTADQVEEVEDVEPGDAVDSYLQSREEEMEEEEEGFIPLRTSIQKQRASLRSSKGKTEALLPITVAKRVSIMKMEGGRTSVGSASSKRTKKRTSAGSQKTQDLRLSRELTPEDGEEETGEEDEDEDLEEETLLGVNTSRESNETSVSVIQLRDSLVNIHFIPNSGGNEHHEQAQGHGVYEELGNYTENVVPIYKLWPNREQTLAPVAEVEIWMKSVNLDVTFNPPFILATGLAKSSVERLIVVNNGTNHTVDITFENINQAPVAVTCHPHTLTISPNQKATLKVMLYFEKCGEVQRLLNGTIALPFTKVPCAISTVLRCYGPFLEVLTPTLSFGIIPLNSETMKTIALKNSGDRPLRWTARIAPEGMCDENNRQISGHQARIHDKRIVRIWPEWGVLEPKEKSGFQVYFCAELSGEVATYVEIMADGNPDSLVSVPVYGEIELPCLFLECGKIEFNAEDFLREPIQTDTGTLINPSGFNVPFAWQCPVGRQCKLCRVHIHPKHGIVPAKGRMEFSISVESLLKDDPLELKNLYVPCCVEGMREPLILKIKSKL